MSIAETQQAQAQGTVAVAPEPLGHVTFEDGPPRTAGREPTRARKDGFRLLALVAVALLLARSFHLLDPWVYLNEPDGPNPDAHRWFYGFSAAVDVFVLVSFAVLMNRLRRPPLAATSVLGLVAWLGTIVPFRPGFLVFLIFILPAYLVYPYRRDLTGWTSWWSGAHRWLLAFAGAVGVAALGFAVVATRRQLVNDGPVAEAHLWSEYAGKLAVIALVGVLAAGTAAGARLLRGWLGLVWIYLGAVATFVLPDATGSWQVSGGLLAMAIGLVFIVSTWWDHRQERRQSEGVQPRIGVTPPQRRWPDEDLPAALPEQRQVAEEPAADQVLASAVQPH